MVDSSKNIREATHLRGHAISHLGGARVPVDIAPQADRASSPNHAQFVSYSNVLARSKVSILVPNWNHVTEVKKNLMWQDICVSNSFKGYLDNKFLCSIFNDLLILFCKQTLILRLLATLKRRLCHLLPQNGESLRQI